MSNYFNFHDLDTKLTVTECSDNSVYCQDKDSEKKTWTPFLSFPVTKKCNFRCIYCGQGGEATASTEDNITLSQIKEITETAISKGIKKFRLTGGEPLLHSDIDEILLYFSEMGYYTLVNSNGAIAPEKTEILKKVNANIKFAVSLDTLDPQLFRCITGRDCLLDTMKGIETLNKTGHLLRCNMVVGRYNINEVMQIIDFCKELGCDLKILDIVSVPVPYGERRTIYQSVNDLEKQLMEKCDEVFSHEYTRGFGTPCFKYKFKGTFVTVKNSKKGSHYDVENGGVCCNCKYYPCHEGLYDIFALSDNNLCACRWTEKQSYETISEQMDYLIEVFRRSKYYQVDDNLDMEARTELMDY